MTPRVREQIKFHRMLGRLYAKVRPDKRKGKVGCRVWKGSVRSDEWGFYEYGEIKVDNKRKLVHRELWEAENGPLGSKVLRNKCENTLCVNPKHWVAKSHWHAADEQESGSVQAA